MTIFLKGVQPMNMLSVLNLITNSINMCDAELRAVSNRFKLIFFFKLMIYIGNLFLKGFFSNIMVTGGNSLLTGFVERLNSEFNHLVANFTIELLI